MKWSVFLPYLAVTAGVTYLIRMLPLTAFRKPIRSRFIQSFLTYTEIPKKGKDYGTKCSHVKKQSGKPYGF